MGLSFFIWISDSYKNGWNRHKKSCGWFGLSWPSHEQFQRQKPPSSLTVWWCDGVFCVFGFSSARCVHKTSGGSKDLAVVVQCAVLVWCQNALCGLQQPKETSSLKPLAICGVATIRNRRFPCSVLMTSAEVCVQELGDKTNVFCYSRC